MGFIGSISDLFLVSAIQSIRFQNVYASIAS